MKAHPVSLVKRTDKSTPLQCAHGHLRGYLFPGHVNFKSIPWLRGSGIYNVGGYTFSANAAGFNFHIGNWANNHLFCFIIDDNTGTTGTHIAFCMDYWILGATAIAIVLCISGSARSLRKR